MWVRDEASTTPDENGAPLYVQGVAIDISDRKEAEAKALLEVARAKVLLHIAARIFAVVDVWDALRSDRPYRPRWLEEKALTYIREQSGKHFEPQIVALFLQMLEV